MRRGAVSAKVSDPSESKGIFCAIFSANVILSATYRVVFKPSQIVTSAQLCYIVYNRRSISMTHVIVLSLSDLVYRMGFIG